MLTRAYKGLIVCCVMVMSLTVAAQGWTIKDSRGEQSLEAAPSRIASLNWRITEQLLELDITPIAVADKRAYAEWVKQPALPEDVEGLGTRAEPNLIKLAALKPDLIFIGEVHLPILPRLERIAPVVFFKSFSAAHDNPQMAIDIYKRLARFLDKDALAARKLAAMKKRFTVLKKQLKEAYSGHVPAVTTVRFADPSSVYIYGDNSMSQYALQQLGIEPALPQENSQWGLQHKRVLELSKIQHGVLLYFEPFAQLPKLESSRLWQAMPFVRAGRINAVPATWTYGGAMSLGYLAEAMAQSLLEISPQSAKAPANE